MSSTEFTHPRQVAAEDPGKLAFVLVGDTDQTLTYRELVERSGRAARLFRALGVEPGQTIAFLLENHIRLPELCWAAKNSGLYYVCISSQLNAADVDYIIENSEARLLVTSRQMLHVARKLSASDKVRMLLVDGSADGFLPYGELLMEQPAEPLDQERRGASMLYSSGTTGRPKGVRMPLDAQPPSAPPRRQKMLEEAFGFGRDMVFANPAPLYHAAPLRMMMAVQRLGGTAIGFDKFDPERTLAAMERHRATHGFFVPTMFIRMLRLPEPMRELYVLPSMRVAIHGAAPCPPDIKRRIMKWWGPVIYEIYGGTEGMGHTMITPQEWLAHPGSVGRPPAGCRLEIRSEDGVALPPGETGLVYFANGSRFSYFKDEAKTAQTRSADGFATFGDVGHVDADGFLYLTDRKSHMIISGGVNIYPQEAEHVLIGHPEVADVAVIGIPDEEFGEQVKAVVEPREIPEDPAALKADIIAYCRERLSAIKCPRSVDFVTTLPRNDLGKVAKHKLREAYWDGRASLII
ncbi:MAG: AMP-binding protein [Allosphingosinicella sp.]|uniref:AMP-binding protein n=1 Tax=Allosphingosinicella sp. TaxID=2823234 RepID=UPI0039605548